MHPDRLERTGVRPWSIAAASLTVLSAPLFFVWEAVAPGIVLLVAGLLAAWMADRTARAARAAPLGASGGARVPIPASAHGGGGSSRPPSLIRDLSLIAIGLGIVRLIPLAAELDDRAMLRFVLALGGAVAVPYSVSRFVYRDRAIRFPWRGPARRSGRRGWSPLQWAWLGAVIVLGWLILPFYFIGAGVYRNWPAVETTDLIARLFIGVGAVGIWDELFFICTVFALLLRHFPPWLANLLQAVVFVSFLWELGYRAWGPLLTIPFALVQGYIFLRTRSLGYVVTVHLLFDAVVFAVLVHAHHPAWLDVFPTAP